MIGLHRIDRWWRGLTEQGPADKVSAIVLIALIATHVCIGLLCAFAPLSIASSPAVAHYAEILSGVVPSIGAFTRVSSFPAHTQLTLVVLWTCVPISAFIVARVPWFWIPDMTSLRRRPWALILLVLALGFMVLVATRFDFQPTALHSWRGTPIAYVVSHVRILLGIVAGLTCAAVALCIGYLCRVPSLAREVLHDDFR